MLMVAKIVDIQQHIESPLYGELLLGAAGVSAAVFHGHADPSSALVTLAAQAQAYPVYRLYLALELPDGKSSVNVAEVEGYILWRIEGGADRERVVVELDQLAVSPRCQGRGIGKQLIVDSRARLGGELAWRREERRRGSTSAPPALAGIRWTVWLYESNEAARKLYDQLFPTCGGRRDYYGRPEVMLYKEAPAPPPIQPDLASEVS